MNNLRILLHIGQSKTGTSAIQAYLTLNRERLREAGVLYPTVTIGGMPVDLGNHNWVADAIVGLSRYPYLTADQYFNQFFNEARRCNANMMILSGEHFFGGEPRIWNVSNDKIYFELYRNKIERLAKYLQGHDVTILVYLRSQVDWLSSAISQTVRIERLIREKPIYQDDYQFFDMAKPILRYCTLLDIWNEVLRPKKIMVVPYIRSQLYKKSSIYDFLHRAELDNLDFPFRGDNLSINRSLSWEYIEVKKILNRKPRSKNEERVIIACLERLSAKMKEIVPYRISADLAQKVEQFVEHENAALNKYYIKDKRYFLKARSKDFRCSDGEKINREMIMRAMEAFHREYAKPRTKILKIDLRVRAFLRDHVIWLHSALHQLRRAYIRYRYKR